MQDLPDAALAATFVDIARRFEAAEDPADTQARITRAAVDTVPGCAHASISMVRRNGGVTTVAPTDDVPAMVDAIQYRTGQGPCLEAIWDSDVVHIDDLATDDRWPRFAAQAVADTPVRSILAAKLFVQDDVIGALNLFAETPNAFDDHDAAVASILAGHAALAVSAAREKEHADNLDQALRSSREIGVAMGVLMARGGLTREQAFGVLREASQRLNVKLRDVAADVADTGQLPVREPVAGAGD
ncbi:GAF and ANTAR domain-containing protein [Pseudonocardia sp. CA-107938]|uniref:GAF and ANTAR domain-containing protein n=1 Tax=Pseudonocardia sp. CA-107938 TaxID=3240021 RepID=UPI003D8DE230